MTVGEDVTKFLTQANISGFLEHVQLFFVEASVQIKQWFPINDDILKPLMFLNPDTINSTTSTKALEIACKFPSIITVTERLKLDDEWNELQFTDPNDFSTTFIQHWKDVDVVTFWDNISRMVDTSWQKRFPVI